MTNGSDSSSNNLYWIGLISAGGLILLSLVCIAVFCAIKIRSRRRSKSNRSSKWDKNSNNNVMKLPSTMTSGATSHNHSGTGSVDFGKIVDVTTPITSPLPSPMGTNYAANNNNYATTSAVGEVEIERDDKLIGQPPFMSIMAYTGDIVSEEAVMAAMQSDLDDSGLPETEVTFDIDVDLNENNNDFENGLNVINENGVEIEADIEDNVMAIMSDDELNLFEMVSNGNGSDNEKEENGTFED